MTSFHRLVPALVAPALVILSGDIARAQTIAPSGQAYPDRLVNGQSLGPTTRPAPLTPLGISYADCAADMTLRFVVTLSGFTGDASLQVWGSVDSDCTSPTDRGIGATSARCWGLGAGGLVNPIINDPASYTFDVRVQDLVGWENGAPPIPGAASPPPKGAEACSAQKTSAARPMNIDFLAVDSTGAAVGTPYEYRIPTDLRGPPAPVDVTLTVLGADQLQAAWVFNTDADTRGYDVFLAADAQTTCATSPLSLLASGGGGPAAPLAKYLVGAGGAGITVTDPQVTTYDIGPAGPNQASALVAAVDGFGNVGPTSALACEEIGSSGGSGGSGSSGHGGCSAVAAASPGRGLLEGATLVAAVAVARRRPKRRARIV